MEMEMPQVAICMAIYKPNMRWLIEQLESLNQQTYKDLSLMIWNDCPKDKTDYESLCRRYITKFPYKIFGGKKNLGSNGAFAELTKLAETKYLAYCDQDDIWLPEKISILVAAIQESRAELICTDMYVINGAGRIIADSIAKARPHQKFYEGEDQFEYLLGRNFVTGCTTLVSSRLAKKTLPFTDEYVHDWWLAIYAAADNSLQILREPLIKYRIHSANQTGLLNGINNKQDYYEKRITVLQKRIDALYGRFQNSRHEAHLSRFKKFVQCRRAYYEKPSAQSLLRLYKMRKCNWLTAYFEMLLPFMPNWLFKFLIWRIRKGRL
jgi:glycosyltransferase involved in cell wall biosynthesis